jgi:hypothetical protein
MTGSYYTIFTSVIVITFTSIFTPLSPLNRSKYIFKHITKGHDKANATIMSEKDGVERPLQCHYISPTQAVWAIMQYQDRASHPAVQQLALHLENAQMIQFNPDEDLQDQVNNAREKNRTTLQRWFAYNQEHDDAQDILYGDFPQYFSWDRTQKPHSWARSYVDLY